MRPGTWQVPECPHLIEYSAAVLDEIRLAAVDGFFSLPHGGMEIGGVIFGRRSGESVRIEAIRPMECEHAMGPTFVLSENDKEQLKCQLEQARRDPLLEGLEIVGWYHSHTRSEIFLSDLDMELYDGFFPEMWQVALVVRPSGLKPVRAGFFFRGGDGSVRRSSSYHEFILGAVDPSAAAMGAFVPQGLPSTPPLVEKPAQPAPTNPEMPFSAANAAQEKESLQAEFVPPAFMMPLESKPSRVRFWVVLSLLVLAAGGAAYLTSGSWMQAFLPKTSRVRLHLFDHDGQLSILWDRAALASVDLEEGTLEILDGTNATTVMLNPDRLHSGQFDYARSNYIVQVHLTVKTARGATIEEYSSFYGQPPGAVNSSALEQQRIDLTAEAEQARSDLKKQELRTRELQRSLELMRQLLRRENERRGAKNQMPAAASPLAEEQIRKGSLAEPAEISNARTTTPASNLPTIRPSSP